MEPVPLREALINAIVHNDYSREIPPVFETFSDRMELTSYGGLVPVAVRAGRYCSQQIRFCDAEILYATATIMRKID